MHSSPSHERTKVLVHSLTFRASGGIRWHFTTILDELELFSARCGEATDLGCEQD